MFFLVLGALLLLAITMVFGVTGQAGRVRSVLLAAAAATPGSAATILVLNGGGSHTWSDWLLSALLMTCIGFVPSLLFVVVFGIPISALLQRMRWTSCQAYVAAGAAVPLVLFG